MSIPNTIKALQIQPDKTVKVVEIPFGTQDVVKNLPEDQMILRVRAVGLNPTDWKHALTGWGTPGAILGCDSAGDIVQVGSAVKHLKVGDRAGTFTYGGSSNVLENGAYAEYVRVHAFTSFKLPDGMTYEEAASFPIPHVAAVQTLYMRLDVPKPLTSSVDYSKREILLIWGGSTAVGHHTIQLANLSGLRVFVTASPGAFDELRAIGVEQCFDYNAAGVSKQIQAAAGEEGIIYGLDCVCVNGSTDAVVDAMSPTRGGHIVTLLSTTPETQKRRADVKLDFALGYTVFGHPFTFANMVKFPAFPNDKPQVLEYMSVHMPRVLEGWKEGQGSPHFQTQRLRIMKGGLDRIHEGLEIMRDGKYGREKLVYRIAYVSQISSL